MEGISKCGEKKDETDCWKPVQVGGSVIELLQSHQHQFRMNAEGVSREAVSNRKQQSTKEPLRKR